MNKQYVLIFDCDNSYEFPVAIPKNCSVEELIKLLNETMNDWTMLSRIEEREVK